MYFCSSCNKEELKKHKNHQDKLEKADKLTKIIAECFKNIMNDKEKKIKKYLGDEYSDIYFNKKKENKSLNDFSDLLEKH